MISIYEVFNINSDLQLNNLLNKLDLTADEMFKLDDIINDGRLPLKDKRNMILEMMMYSSDENYNICKNAFKPRNKKIINESNINNSIPSQLNMNQTIELNKLFTLASEKFKKINCSQQFYQMLAQKTSKNVANAFFNMLKSIPEDSDCRFDPELIVDGQNFAQTIYPYVNELTTFLNGCKSENKKKEVDESIETQPDMFGGADTYYKDGIEALDFDNVLDAMNKIAPEMDFVDDRDVKGKYSMIFQPKSSGLELNQKGLKKIKDYLSQKFGKENISVRLAHSQYAPEIKKLYVTFINQIDVQDELENNQLNESELTNKLDNLKYHISVSSDEKTLKHIKNTLSNYFNQTKDTEDRNKLSEIISMINSKLNKINPEIDECCGIDSLLEPFKPTVINITVNDDGCLKDTEKEMCANSMKALASHINDSKDPCQENNIENMETINSLLGTIANYFYKKLYESQSIVRNPHQGDTIIDNAKASIWRPDDELEESSDIIIYDPQKELNDIKQRYLDKEIDIYDATNEVDNIIGDKSNAEAIVDSWDDPSKHGLYGIEDDEDEELDEMCSGGACCAGAVATVPSPAKPKSPKRKHKKSKVDEMALNMFKRQIIEDVNSQIIANGNHYEYKDGFLYINGDIAKTKSKYQMLEALDEMIELDTLKGFNSNEMLMLEDIEASGNVGNEDDNNQNNNNNSNNNADNNNNQQNANQTPNQDNLGDVNQNVTQDNDLTPQQRQLKQDNEKVLDQSLNSGNDTNVSVNQGMDNNNDQTSSSQSSSNNIKYKVIGKDDSDLNNIKYIIQDPNSKQTQIVDATKLRLEK